MFKKIILTSLFLSLFMCGAAFAAKTPDPMLMLQQTSDEMLVALEKERPKTRTSDEWLYRLVNKIVVPHVDVTGMSRSVIGRNVWLNSSPSQRKVFIREFKRVVIKTYSNALNAYTNETIRFFPIRGDFEDMTNLLINSKVIRADGPPVPLDYRLILIDNDWKIYDFIVEGISLLQSFHSQFASELSGGKTLDKLTHDLHIRNQESS